jgi:dTDP-glucose 4,6-dehydratase
MYAKMYGLQTKIARCFAFVGPYLPLDIHYAIGNFIRDGLQGGPIRVNGDGTPYRSYLYAADLALWLWTILFRGASCRPYNVGADVDIQIGVVAKVVAESFNPVIKVNVVQQAMPGRPAERYVPSTQRAQIELGLRSKIDLHETIKRTVAWHSQVYGKE